MIHHGDCLDVMAGMPSASVDAVVTDPPYDLTSGKRGGSGAASLNLAHPAGRSRITTGGGFMGKAWDASGIAFRPETWAAMLRVARPSAYLLAFGGTRTYHRMTTAIEDAGWIIRDCLVWAYASGFPKSRALLKPAWEPIVMARKPGPLRELAIDECRIPGAPPSVPQPMFNSPTGATYGMRTGEGRNGSMSEAEGRWPANLLLTDPIFDGDTPGVVGGGIARSSGEYEAVGRGERAGPASIPLDNGPQYGDSGTYSRFFLIPKADRAEREPVMPSGLPLRNVTSPAVERLKVNHPGGLPAASVREPRRNTHPTVKPLDLMRHLVRLVTPTGGTVLDPFLGSGTTALACEMEGFEWVGIEREAEYVAIAEARLNGTQRGIGLAV